MISKFYNMYRGIIAVGKMRQIREMKRIGNCNLNKTVCYYWKVTVSEERVYLYYKLKIAKKSDWENMCWSYYIWMETEPVAVTSVAQTSFEAFTWRNKYLINNSSRRHNIKYL